MTIAVLRSLHAIIGDAIDDIERIYVAHGSSADPQTSNDAAKGDRSSLFQKVASQTASRPEHESSTLKPNSQAYASPPPSPSITTAPEYTSSSAPTPASSADAPRVDFPSLDSPCDPTSMSETLTTHPSVVDAIGRIVAAAGQLSATVQTPFLTLCDAIMGYHLQSCMRLFEASHVPEILRDAGRSGLHVDEISRKNGVQASKLAHVLRLLAAHHILREVSPDVFALNRVSSMVDSGKMFSELKTYQDQRTPEMKYSGGGGIAAFVGLCTDEIQKASAYMTEAYYLSSSQDTREGKDPAQAPFCFAFNTLKSRTAFFPWGKFNSNKFRLERFGKAMSGSEGWEAPGAILNGFDWHSLPRGSIVVDVGGGIGSTSMLLATAFSSDASKENLGLLFVIQDRPVVCQMGEKAWQEKCPELLDSETARFQVHDFFTPQPIRNASVFLLRCILHDWPTGFARKILLRLRQAAMPDTKLVIADFILPLACQEDNTCFEGVEGAETLPPPAPLLPNLGKANANVYWMDLTMQVMFNSQERTLREMIDLTSSAGWKIVKVTRTPGSSLGYLIAVPIPLPPDAELDDEAGFIPRDGSDGTTESTKLEEESGDSIPDRAFGQERRYREDMEMLERASSRCGTPTFGSHTRLSSVQDALARFGGGIIRSKAMARSYSSPSSGSIQSKPLAPPIALKPALSVAAGKKKRPSPLSVPPLHSSPTPLHSPSPTLKVGSASPRLVESPRPHSHVPIQTLSAAPKIVPRRKSFANLRSPQPLNSAGAPPLPILSISSSSSRQPPPSPLSPLHPEAPVPTVPRTPIRRRASHAQLTLQPTGAFAGTVAPLPSMIPVPVASSSESPPKRMLAGSPSTTNSLRHQRSSNTLQVPPHVLARKRSGTVAGNSNFAGGERLSGPPGLRGHARQMSASVSSEMSNSRRPMAGNGSVLAAAARIERGELLQRPSSP
ncbi:hypothetical protein CVT26_010246 [Gymnopilus dilepis]|uniref:O-methyltransferase C-terminal domain-containing protein n=1 Tax=Gymnopilus dilepis TaxID=231916 RepID=A0A409Y0Y3_9AGAR|nr:hypothetical protein CVT26_010246 [Gymnopilus dilepis]